MDIHELKAIIKRYNEGKASPEEIAFVEEWYDNLGGDNAAFENDEQRRWLKQQIGDAVKKHISEEETQSDLSCRERSLYSKLKWAAIITAGIFSFALYNNYKKKNSRLPGAEHISLKQNDISPGGNKAVLVLSDGSRITLDSAKNGVLATQGTANIVKTSGGKLVYNATGRSVKHKIWMNNLVTPRGGQYRVTLPDGTEVWLNASSSLQFPAAFTGGERIVKLNGEAYFEVTKDKKRPFRVISGHTNIEVFGTHFNVMAYDNEKFVETTLLEGSVKVSTGSRNLMLRPGQQARSSVTSAAEIKVRDADTEEAVAWKNGLFYFNEADLAMIMRQISRWYDVEVVYEGKLPEGHFRGKVSRNEKLSQVLKILELNGINFTVEGRKIIVKT